MNNRLHKVIFNRNTGLMDVVAETAHNNGKSSKDKRFQVALFNLSGRLLIDLTAAKDVNIKAAKEIGKEHNNFENIHAAVGAAISFNGNGASIGVTAEGEYGKGKANGDNINYRNSYVGSSTGQTNISAGKELNINGGQILGKGVKIDAQKLNIETVQNAMNYNSNQFNASVDFTIGYGASAGGNVSASKIKANYQSINEQSGIFAGDDGYQINIKDNTHLNGGLITSTANAEQNGKNRFETGTITFKDLANKAEYKGEAFGIGISGSVKGNNPNSNSSIYTVDKTGMSNTMGYGRDKESQSSITYAGINTANITIRDTAKQQALTGKLAEEAIKAVKTNITLENHQNLSGRLDNNFDANRVQNEIDLQREVTQEFDKNRKALRAEINQKADENRKKAEDIRKENYIDGKNGYNTAESLALDKSADKLEKVAFYTDLALGGLYGLGSTDALTYATGSAVTNSAVRAGTRPRQFWLVKCNGDSLYCSNYGYDKDEDEQFRRTSYDEKGRIEIGDKRQIFDLSEIKPSETTGVITKSNNGILNYLDAALRNAVKQNKTEVGKDGIVVIYNSPTGNYLSELLYAGYDKLNDNLGGRLPLTSAQKANLELNQYAANNHYKIDSSNHSRGGMTESIVTKYSLRNGLELPYNEVRFFGSAANVQDYKDYTQKYDKDFTVKAATHYTDFVGRTPLVGLRSKYIVGGNKPTGGAEDRWFLYSHSDYFAEKPNQFLQDNQGHYIDENGKRVKEADKVENPYLKRFNERWVNGENHNKVTGDNPSLPVEVLPSSKKDK